MVPLSTKVYNWVPAHLIQGFKLCDGLESYPGGVENTPSYFILLMYINQHQTHIIASLIRIPLGSRADVIDLLYKLSTCNVQKVIIVFVKCLISSVCDHLFS